MEKNRRFSLNQIIDEFYKKYGDEFPEINGVGANSEQSINGVVFKKRNIVVYIEHKDNILILPSIFMDVDVIYHVGEG